MFTITWTAIPYLLGTKLAAQLNEIAKNIFV